MPIQIKIIRPKRYCPACGGLAREIIPSSDKYSVYLIFEWVLYAILIFMFYHLYIGCILFATWGISALWVSNWLNERATCLCGQCGLKAPLHQFKNEKYSTKKSEVKSSS